MIYVWVLVVGFGFDNGLVIPDIASKRECWQLGVALNDGNRGWSARPFKCVQYGKGKS